MDTLPYEAQAAAGDPLPTGLDYPDQVMYLNLRCLYAALQNLTIDRDTAMKDKRELLDKYRVYKFNWEQGDHWAKIIKETELARCAYRKDRTLENADKLLNAVEGSL